MSNTKMTDKQKVTTMADSDYVFGNFGGKVGQMSIPDFRSHLYDDSPDGESPELSALKSRISAVEGKNTEQDTHISANTMKIETVESTANDAKSAAETAKTAADTAQETANSAQETATAAQAIAQEAKETAEDAKKIKEYKLLHSHTFTEDATSSDYELLTADDGTPIHQYKDILIFAELSYVKDGSSMLIYLNTTKFPKGYIAQIVSQTFTTHYIFKLKIDGLNTTLYSENHTNAFSNPQFSDGNQGRNFITFYQIEKVFTYDRLTINFPFKANNKILIYGR